MEVLNGIDINQLLSIPYGAPIAVTVGSIFLSIFLGVPFWLMLILSSLPFFVLYLDLPIVSEIKQAGYLWVFVASYLIIFCFLLGRRVARGFGTGLSIISFLFHVVLWSAAGVVGLLYLYPEVLEQYAGNWQEHAGLLLLGVALLGAAVSAISFVRASAIVAFWLFIALSLGSEIFLGKLPPEVFPSQLRKSTFSIPLQSSSQILSVVSSTLSDIASDAVNSGQKIVLSLGGPTTLGEPYNSDSAYPAQLEKQLNKRLAGNEIKVLNLATTTEGVESLRMVLEGAIKKVRPTIVTVEASPETDLGGLEPPPLELGEDEGLMRKIMSGRIASLVRYLFTSESEANTSAERAGLGVSLDDGVIRSIMQSARKVGAKAVFIFSPKNMSDRPANNELMKASIAKVVREEGGHFLDVEKTFDSEKYVQLFVAKDLPTRAGHKLVASELATQLMPILSN